jgi:hypothetical protein
MVPFRQKSNGNLPADGHACKRLQRVRRKSACRRAFFDHGELS